MLSAILPMPMFNERTLFLHKKHKIIRLAKAAEQTLSAALLVRFAAHENFYFVLIIFS